jgi:hypothetical protein
MAQLTTLQKVKDALGIVDTSKDDLLEDFIDQASAMIQTEIGRDLEAKERTEIYDQPEGDNLFLKHYPILTDEDLVVSYRTGQVATPVWVPYTTNDYFVYPEEGYLRMVNVFADEFMSDWQAFQVTYTGGYLIDFANEGDPTKHTLPADITGVATQVVTKMYNLKSSEGLNSESTEGQSVTYGSANDKDLSFTQKRTLGAYARTLV